MSLASELRQPTLEQAVKNHVKVIRTAIRLKHAIQADNELAEVLPQVRAMLAAQMQTGRIQGISVTDMMELVG